MWLPYWLHTFMLLIAYVCFWIYHHICCYMLTSICTTMDNEFYQLIGSLLPACWERVASLLPACWERVGCLYTPKVAPIWCNVSYDDMYRYQIFIHSDSLPCGSILAPMWLHIGSHVAPYWLHTFVLLIAYVCGWIYHDIRYYMLISICTSIYIHYG